MNLFHVIEDGAAILRVKGGLFRQAKIYRREQHVYAAVSGGYIRLTRSGATTNPNVSWLEVEGPGVTLVNNLPAYVEPKTRTVAKGKLAVVNGR